VIDYRAVDFADAFKNVDIVLESVGGDYGERSLRTLRPGGLFITIVDRLNEELAQRARAAGKRFAGFSVEPDQVGLEGLVRLVDTGELRIHVEKTFQLEAAGEAHRFLATNPKGKIVLTV
jgi:NADPH:quinone reductase-like Zn-dependent oxidoreductase